TGKHETGRTKGWGSEQGLHPFSFVDRCFQPRKTDLVDTAISLLEVEPDSPWQISLSTQPSLNLLHT
nr:hypothetical protein [Nitrospira sp.]